MNRYSKALKQLKSTDIDSKIKKLEEAPTNNTKGVYSLNPSGYRVGPISIQWILDRIVEIHHKLLQLIPVL